MTDTERLYRAASFCHSLAVIAHEHGRHYQFKTWMQHGRAYASAARIVAGRNRRTDSKQEPTDLGRIEEESNVPKDGLFTKPDGGDA